MGFAGTDSRFCSNGTPSARKQSGHFGSRRVLSAGDLCAPVSKLAGLIRPRFAQRLVLIASVGM
jgi:hypothetical protein